MIYNHISDIKWMKRAIYLASLGKGRTSPNPLVGAVILDKHGNLISEGFHSKSEKGFMLLTPPKIFGAINVISS